MIEKNGTITLTDGDLEEYNSGNVSQRIYDNWGLTLSELREIVESKSYIKL